MARADVATPAFGVKLEFDVDKVLSDKSYFGVVYRAQLKQQAPLAVAVKHVAVKQVLLCSGLHYDRLGKQYVAGGKTWCSTHARRALDPKFHKRRCMPVERFTRECAKMHQLWTLGLAPQVLGYWTERSGPAHYGFLVMQLCDGTVKDVIAKRPLDAAEDALVLEVISRFHGLGYAHGDLKPSNVGVLLGADGRVTSALIIDCATVAKPRRGLKGDVKDDNRRYRRRLKQQSVGV